MGLNYGVHLYMEFFSIVNSTALRDPLLVESVDVEERQIGSCENYSQIFHCAES